MELILFRLGDLGEMDDLESIDFFFLDHVL